MITTFSLPTRIIFGVGSIDRLGEEAGFLGQRAIIVTYPDIRRIGLLDRVQEILTESGVEFIVFDEVEPNPRSSTVDKGARIVADEKVDLVIGLGGGSAMDTAKAMILPVPATNRSGITLITGLILPAVFRLLSRFRRLPAQDLKSMLER